MSRPTDEASRDAPAPSAPPARYVAVARKSPATIAFYLILAGILLLVNDRSNFIFPSFPAVLALILLLFLVRYVSTRYSLDSEQLLAWRLFGSRRVRLEEIRRIEYANLRDLGPVGLIGTWGWRGRVWSPTVGKFDTVHTVSDGLLISAGDVPLFVSPADPRGFARELSRRARSWGVELEPDAASWTPRGPAA